MNAKGDRDEGKFALLVLMLSLLRSVHTFGVGVAEDAMNG